MSIHLRIVWRNIWRNPRRTVLTLAAIAFSCVVLVFMIAFQIGSYDSMISSAVRTSVGHLQVQAEGYHESYTMRDAIREPGRVVAALEQLPQVTALAPRARAFALASSEDRSYGVLVTGIEPEREAEVTRLAEMVRDGSYLGPDEPYGSILGQMLARNLKVGVGDEVTIIGQGFDGSVAATVVTVTGIFSAGVDELDRQALFMPLAAFDETFTMRGGVHEVAALCTSLDGVSRAKASLVETLDARTLEQVSAGDGRNGSSGADAGTAGTAGTAATEGAQTGAEGSGASLVVLDWDDLMPGLMQGIKVDLAGGIIFYLALIVVVAFSILNTYLMAFFERIRELGVLLAIGTSPQRLVRLFLLESVLLTAIGVVVGTVGGCVITYWFQVHGIELGSETTMMAQYGMSSQFFPQLTPLTALTGPAAVLLITSLASLYPALKIRRLRPVEAMNHV